MDDLGQVTLNHCFPVNMREGVIWSYRLLLGRDPSSEAEIEHHLVHHNSIDALRSGFMSSAEYISRCGLGLGAEARSVLAAFAPFCTTPAPAGSFHDFLGVRTRCEYLPAAYVAWSGQVGGPPGSNHGLMHDTEEWLGTLRSVLEAQSRLVVVELGAGWAPWLVAATKAAERVGITDVQLVGVEGAADHIPFMHSHLRDNGIEPTAHRLLHAVIGVEDGTAQFPEADEPNEDYGSIADYTGSQSGRKMIAVASISLRTLLADIAMADIMHCDIQGAENDVLASAMETLNNKVRRLVVGTHGRIIEAQLLDLFSAQGWRLEADVVCKSVQADDGRLLLLADGCQVWRNPRLALPT